jgi:hypothetical protein
MPVDGITLDTRVRRTETVFSSSVGDDLVIFDHNKGAYYGSGPVGEAIWSLIAEERRVDDLCDLLMKRFEVERGSCEAEVLAFLEELGERGLLKAS